MTLVPKDLLRGLERAPERSQRLLVTAWVLADNGAMPDREALTDAQMLWPRTSLELRGRVTVLSVLLELERLGLVRDVAEQGVDYFEATAVDLSPPQEAMSA